MIVKLQPDNRLRHIVVIKINTIARLCPSRGLKVTTKQLRSFLAITAYSFLFRFPNSLTFFSFVDNVLIGSIFLADGERCRDSVTKKTV